MELVIITVMLFLVVIIFKRVINIVYFIAVIDIFLRIVAFINSYIPWKQINTILDKIPASVPTIIDKYTSGVVNDILMWVLVACYILLEYYIIKTVIQRKH